MLSYWVNKIIIYMSIWIFSIEHQFTANYVLKVKHDTLKYMKLFKYL